MTDLPVPAAGKPYRVIVTGSREWTDKATLYAALDAVLAEHPHLVIVNGKCHRGADAWAVSWVMDRWTWQEADVSHEDHPADWRGYGKSAVCAGARTCLDADGNGQLPGLPAGQEPAGA